jgi:hypothetical protein
MAPPSLLAWLALPACLLASSPPGARLVHLGPGLTEPTHALLRGQFFPDAPDNPHRKHFRYTLDVWAWVETVLGLGQSIAAVGPAGELLGVCLANDLARPGPPASPGQPWPPRPGQGELVTIAGPFLEGDVASPTPRQQVPPGLPPPRSPGPGGAVARLADGPGAAAGLQLGAGLRPRPPPPPAAALPHPLHTARAARPGHHGRRLLPGETHGAH